MASKSSDGWLWVSLAILGYFGSLAVHRQLVVIRQASEVTRHDKRPNISQQTEDALKLKALGELTQSPDQDIRAASVKIITDRVLREGPAWDMIIGDIGATDIERRDKALACLRFLSDTFPGNKQADFVMICRHSTYKAIVDCLCNLLPEAQSAERKSAFRTQPERNALYVLHHILGYDNAKAVEAGVISRWLAQYPFGGGDASKYKKKKTIMEILDNRSYYEDGDFGRTMREMLFCMSRIPLLRDEMVEHGLLDFPKGNHITDYWNIPEGSERTYPHTNRTRRGNPTGTSNRPREESFEEQALRRRRREAMVLGEVGRPIERADIIERDSAALDGFRSQVITTLDDESEEEPEQPVVAVADEDAEEELELLAEETIQAESTRDGGWWGWLKRLRPDGLAPEPM
ncbi:hypothetical protein HO133_004489 [Letharia lupina]|uniref:Uncharacterized protein n=1 Tax=Letharia lupina TaxID=560253 RepID=A0A8H6FKE7_9LECA|nr:uncharacterized protein HO133_004489 [Letharia lupina]KAF6230150.1 hypothetical protein HO133_004489 [Letharia lupina]